MYFKADKNTDLYKQLQEFDKKGEQYSQQAKDLIKEFGGNPDEYYFSDQRDVLYGGIVAISFEEKPEGWVKRGAKWQSLYMPASKNDKAWEKILALPTLTCDDVNKIFKFKQPGMTMDVVGEGLRISKINTLGYILTKDWVLLDVPKGAKWKPLPGCIEILTSEYEKLSEKNKAA